MSFPVLVFRSSFFPAKTFRCDDEFSIPKPGMFFGAQLLLYFIILPLFTGGALFIFPRVYCIVYHS